MTLSKMLKIYREECRISQTAVAEELNVSRQSISKWETGKCYPDLDNLVLLSKLYRVSIDTLLNETSDLKNS